MSARNCPLRGSGSPSSRAKSGDPVELSFGFAAGFLDFASLRSEWRFYRLKGFDNE